MQINESIKNKIKKQKLKSEKSLFDDRIFANAIRDNENIHNEIVSEIEIIKGNFNGVEQYNKTNGADIDTPRTPPTQIEMFNNVSKSENVPITKGMQYI